MTTQPKTPAIAVGGRAEGDSLGPGNNDRVTGHDDGDIAAAMTAAAAPVALEWCSADDLTEVLAGRLPLRFGTALPDGWPEFPEAIPHDLERLRADDGEAGWTMHFVVDRATGEIVGSGGYVAAPVGGVVEIGYELAPAFRGRGLGMAAAAALSAQAFDRGVTVVRAQTLPHVTPSSRLLVTLGFTLVGNGDGETWTWELAGAGRSGD